MEVAAMAFLEDPSLEIQAELEEAVVAVEEDVDLRCYQKRNDWESFNYFKW